MRKPAEPLGTPRNTLGNPCGTPAEPLLPERRRRTFLTTQRLHGDLLRLPGRSTQTEDENVRGLFQPVVLLEKSRFAAARSMGMHEGMLSLPPLPRYDGKEE